MCEIVAADDPIRRMQVPLEEARALFKRRGDDDKLRLMEIRDNDYLVLYDLRGNRTIFSATWCPPPATWTPSTCALPADGFLIMYPRRESPTVIRP